MRRVTVPRGMLRLFSERDYVTFAICYRNSFSLSSVKLVNPTQLVEINFQNFFHHTIAQRL